MGLSHAKGAIAVGREADFAVVDLNAAWVLDKSYLRSSAGYSLYDGMAFKGRVVHTILRGSFVMRDRQLIDEAVGKGRYMPRLLGSAAASATTAMLSATPDRRA